jgi:hypothetical protein
MPHEEHEECKLTAADPRDLAGSVALALRFFEGRKRNHDADAFRANIAAERVVRHLARAGFVVMKKPPRRHSALGWDFQDQHAQRLVGWRIRPNAPGCSVKKPTVMSVDRSTCTAS